MQLKTRQPDYEIPVYSPAQDVIAYLTCRLQYRYYNRGLLPRANLSQFWYGQMVHQTLDMCFHHWNESVRNGRIPPNFPWPCNPPSEDGEDSNRLSHDIGRIAGQVEDRLRREGLHTQGDKMRESAYRQVGLAVNQLGPHLFPLIESAERKLSGSRVVPSDTGRIYEVVGVLDTLSRIRLARSTRGNIIRRRLLSALPELNGGVGEFEVVIDYKGTHRPPENDKRWKWDEFQVQTYAWLRRQQPDSPPVKAAILIYVNELEAVGAKMRAGLEKAVRIVEVSDTRVDKSLAFFDRVTQRIERDVKSESSGLDILKAWYPNCEDQKVCRSCDFIEFCPKPATVP